jgi:HD-GYP domain-containing protein (c-di-GMP phosphodiesterase class II)
LFQIAENENPYRDALPLNQVIGVMSKEAPHRLDGRCFEAMRQVLEQLL